MGQKKVVKVEEPVEEGKPEAASSTPVSKKKNKTKKRVEVGVLYVESTYNNTKLTLTDDKGNTLAWATSGGLGFKGAKKGTPFAAAKVGESLAEKAQGFGVRDVRVVIKGVGSGRESAVRGFISKSIGIISISDMTPIPHNGPKAPKPRRT